MRDLIKLIEKIDKVIAKFLFQKKIGVTPEILAKTSVDEILTNLSRNINRYKNLPAPEPLEPQSTVWKAAVTVVNTVYSLYQSTENTIRFITNTDSRYRLDTIVWLFWTREFFAERLKVYDSLQSVRELRIFLDRVKQEIKAFFQVVNDILNTPADQASAFPIERDGRKLLIYGLKDNASELGPWFRKYFMEQFTTSALIESILEESRERRDVILVRYQPQDALAEHSAHLLSEIKSLQQNNAALQRDLDYANRRAEQYQSELQSSQARSETIVQSLEAKERQERAFEEVIRQLTLEKETIELRQQTQRSADPEQNELLHKEIENMRSRLDAAHGEKEKMLADKRVLESEVEREREQQALLKSQLQRVAQERQELVREIPSPVTSVNELDKTSMLQILQPYAETGDFSAQELAPVSQADDYEELDVTALGERLREHEQQQLLAEKELLLAEAAKHARTKPRFPLEADEVENGCTSAQNHVLNGKINYLQHELMLHPETVNTICRVEANAHSRKTLLEIAMFHLNSLFVTRKSRKALVELILQFRPNILSKQTTTNQESVRHIISSRLVKNDKCDPDLKVLYCQYVIAQTTSSAAARADLNKMMQEAESAHAKLLAAPDVILIDGLRCDVLLRELDDLMRVCRLLHQSYMTGDVMQLAAILKRETPLDDPEFYEVLLGPQEKTWVDDAYQRKHQRSTYRASLLAIIEPRLKQCVVGRPGKKIINNISHDIDMSDEPAQVSPVQQPALVKMKSVPVNREYIDIYESLGTHLSTILLGYGIVLSANGFNSYQLKEIELQKSLEINAAPAQQVQPVASFKQLRL